MNKIYQDNGEYDLWFQIPQILCSLSISSIINIMLTKLSLTEYNFIALKQCTDKVIVEEATKERHQMKSKIIFFFIIGIIYLG